MTYIRHRSRDKLALSGSMIVLATGEVTPFSMNHRSEVTDDVAGKHLRKENHLLPPSDWDHSITERIPPRINGYHGSWGYNQVPIQGGYNPSVQQYPTRGSARRTNENAVWALDLVSKTHPFRSEFSVPVAIAEILDIGSLFRLAAKSFAEYVGNAYLNYKFGWVQFVKDIKTLAGITKALERRLKEFDSLNKHGGLRRKIFIHSNSWDRYGSNFIVHSTFGLFLRADSHVHETTRVSGTIRWRWKGGVTIELSKLEAFNLAVKSLFDLGTIDAETVWNSVPWTWLADYFVAIGPYLAATYSSDLVEPFDICIVREHKVVESWTIRSHTYSNIRTNNGRYTTKINGRDVIYALPVLPPVRFGLISTSQIKVMLALLGRFKL